MYINKTRHSKRRNSMLWNITTKPEKHAQTISVIYLTHHVATIFTIRIKRAECKLQEDFKLHRVEIENILNYTGNRINEYILKTRMKEFEGVKETE